MASELRMELSKSSVHCVLKASMRTWIVSQEPTIVSSQLCEEIQRLLAKQPCLIGDFYARERLCLGKSLTIIHACRRALTNKRVPAHTHDKLVLPLGSRFSVYKWGLNNDNRKSLLPFSVFTESLHVYKQIDKRCPPNKQTNRIPETVSLYSLGTMKNTRQLSLLVAIPVTVSRERMRVHIHEMCVVT